MFYKVLFVSSALLSFGSSSPIIGGTNVGTVIETQSETFAIGQSIYPFMAHLKIFKKHIINGTLFDTYNPCVGIIISTDAVLTAAHCLMNSVTKPEIHVEVGIVDYDMETLTAPGSWSNNFTVHDKFEQLQDPSNGILVYHNDIAIIWLDTPLEFSPTVKSAKLLKIYRRVNNREGSVLGWGYDETKNPSSMLKSAEMRLLSTEDCHKAYKLLVRVGKFCALSEYKSATPCIGDSGAPFVRDGIVYGLFSFGVSTKDNTGNIVCDPTQPAVFTQLRRYMNWIEERLQERERSKARPSPFIKRCSNGHQMESPAKKRYTYQQDGQYNEVL